MQKPSWLDINNNKGLLNYYPGQKNCYSRDIHEIDPQCDHLISCDIDFDLHCDSATASSRRAEAVSRVDVEPKLDIARCHMIKL